jgi:hypothetical protein
MSRDNVRSRESVVSRDNLALVQYLTSEIHDRTHPGSIPTMHHISANHQALEKSTGDPEEQSLLKHDTDRSYNLMYFIPIEMDGTCCITRLQCRLVDIVTELIHQVRFI